MPSVEAKPSGDVGFILLLVFGSYVNFVIKYIYLRHNQESQGRDGLFSVCVVFIDAIYLSLNFRIFVHYHGNIQTPNSTLYITFIFDL